jgi:hypothetical protein
MRIAWKLPFAAAMLLGAAIPAGAQAPPSRVQGMGFFITSANPGHGGDLGGLEGADRHCQALAAAVGAGGRSWRAYLSTQGANAVNARDRIGQGPWRNVRGDVIARTLSELHGENNLTKQTALNERGEVIPGRGDTPNQHDIMTGSREDGTAFLAAEDMTCDNWTSGDAGGAMTGHHDRIGIGDTPAARSWNTSHRSRGCSMGALRSTGGAGLIYCFAE